MNKTIHFLLLCTISINSFSQSFGVPRSFSEFSTLVSQAFNIAYKQPKGFEDTRSLQFRKHSPDEIGFAIYYPILESKDQECTFMYQSPVEFAQYEQTISERVRTEIMRILGLGTCCNCTNRIDIEIEDYAVLLNQEEAKERFNASCVYLLDVPLTSPYKNNYTHCLTILIFNNDNPMLPLLCFFTEVGYANKEHYFNKLSGTIWYNEEGNKTISRDQYSRALSEFFGDMEQGKFYDSF